MSFGGLIFLSKNQSERTGSCPDVLFAFQTSSWLVTEAAGLGPFGHPSVWRPRSLTLFFFSSLPRREGLGLAPPYSFLTGTLDRGGFTSPTPGGPGVKNRSIVVTRPMLCNCRLSSGE